MPRTDISDNLVHFTSGETDNEAFDRLVQIVNQRTLIGGTGMIRGAYRCVCFTEAPLASLPGGLVNPDAYSRYKPFGIMFTKAHVFALGGRPVIYQSDVEFDDLDEPLRWRHMRYEPHAVPRVDFCWEREWRLHTDALPFESDVAMIVLPNQGWADCLMEAVQEREDWRIHAYANVIGGDLAELLRESFGWNILHLR